MSPHTSTSFNTPIRRCLAIAGVTLAALLRPQLRAGRRVREHDPLFRFQRVAHYVGSLDQVPAEYRASAKVPDADLRMPPVTSVGNDRSGRQTWEVEYKRRREEREKQIQKMDQEFRDLQQREAGPQAESAARKSVRELNEREKRLQEGNDATNKRHDEYARWIASCERQERIVDQDRARHWLAYGQRWTDDETAARRRRRSPSPDAARSNEPALTRLASS
jgi:hypothetical protein